MHELEIDIVNRYENDTKIPFIIKKLRYLEELQKYRIKNYKSYSFLKEKLRINNAKETYLFENALMELLIFSLKEWFQAIPFMQSFPCLFLHQYFRKLFVELFNNNAFEYSTGYDDESIRISINSWLSSSIPQFTDNSEENCTYHINFSNSLQYGLTRKLLTTEKSDFCAACKDNQLCQVLNCQAESTVCLAYAALHLCNKHGEEYLCSKNPKSKGIYTYLKDGRRLFWFGDPSWITKNKFDVGAGINLHKHCKRQSVPKQEEITKRQKILYKINSHPQDSDRKIIRDLSVRERALKVPKDFWEEELSELALNKKYPDRLWKSEEFSSDSE